MFTSIKEDIRNTFSYGNMVNKIIIVNVGFYMVFALINAFAPSFYASFADYFMLPSSFGQLIRQPWSLITHMFFHEGFRHLLWNMLLFYTFGNIFGDLVGDRKILPVYVAGGLIAALLYMLAVTFASSFFFLGGGYALGASASILAIVFAAVAISPDYSINLILIGPVRIKYIGLLILFFDIIGTRGMDNSGGHVMHLGGTMFGFLYVYLLSRGSDILDFEWVGAAKRKKRSNVARSKKSMTVVSDNRQSRPDPTSNVDSILEKIKKSGFDSLTENERNILENASKKD